MGFRPTLAGLLGVTAAISTPIASRASATRTVIEYVERTRPAGGTGSRISAGFLEDVDANSEVRGEKWHGRPGTIGFAGKMLRDAHVRKSIDYILHPIAAAKWIFRPVSSDPLDIEVADFLTWSFFERLPWPQIVRRVGVSYFAHGFALEELTDSIQPLPRGRFPNHPRATAALLPTGFHQRPAWSVYRWHQSKTNPAQLESIQQYLRGSDQEDAGFPYISADRLVRWTWDQDGADFDGLAILRSAYGSWKAKQLLTKLYLMGAEKHAVGTPIGELGDDASDDEIDAFETALSELRSNHVGYMVHPKDWKVDFKSGTAGLDCTIGIELCNTDIATNVGAGYMRLGLTGNSGSHALSGTQQGHHHLEVDGHSRFIATSLWVGTDGWSPAERYVRANYGPDVAVPRPEAVNLPTRNWAEVAKTYGTLKAQGAIRADAKTEDMIREAMGLPPHDPNSAYAIASAPKPQFKEAPGEASGEGASLETPGGPDSPGEPPHDGEDTTEEEAA